MQQRYDLGEVEDPGREPSATLPESKDGSGDADSMASTTKSHVLPSEHEELAKAIKEAKENGMPWLIGAALGLEVVAELEDERASRSSAPPSSASTAGAGGSLERPDCSEIRSRFESKASSIGF